jgi:hypothetical protein
LIYDLTAPLSARLERRALKARIASVRRAVAALDPRQRAHLAGVARDLGTIRERIGSLTGEPTCCARCAARLPDPLPQFPGGHCCGSETSPITLELELAALLLGGFRPDRARVTRVHAGCLFRTPRGCILAPRERPSLCVAYLCTDLKRELARAGSLPGVIALSDALAAGMAVIREALGPSFGPGDMASRASCTARAQHVLQPALQPCSPTETCVSVRGTSGSTPARIRSRWHSN